MLGNRVVVVTGAARGIGRSHCLELSAHGATVVVNDLAGEGSAEREASAHHVVAEITELGGEATAFECSVTDLDAVREMVADTVARHGRLDGVVNNAGIIRDRMITSMTEDEFDSVVGTHLKGTWALTKCAAEHWRATAKAGERVRGRIVNTTSGSGLFGNVGQTNYGAAKAGIANMTMTAAMELARYGVTVNAISPLARTRMTENMPSMQSGPADGFDRFDPGNSSPVVAWLLSEAAGWLTGAILRVDGGTVSRMVPWQIDPVIRHDEGSQRVEASRLDHVFRRAFGIAPSGMPSGVVTSS